MPATSGPVISHATDDKTSYKPDDDLMTTAGTARPREHKSPMSKQQSAVSHELIEHIALTISPDKTLPSAESTNPTGVMMLTPSHANLAKASPQAIDTRNVLN